MRTLLTLLNQMEVSLNYCSQNGGNVYRAPYYNRNPNIGPRIDSNLDQSPDGFWVLSEQGASRATLDEAADVAFAGLELTELRV